MEAALGRVEREIGTHASAVCLQHIKEMVAQETKEFSFNGILEGNQARICRRVEPKPRPIQTSPSVQSTNSVKKVIKSPLSSTMTGLMSKRVKARKLRIVSGTPSADTDSRKSQQSSQQSQLSKQQNQDLQHIY